MPKKGENVRKRKDGRWEGRYSVKDVYCGTTQVRSVYAKSYAEVRKKLAHARQASQEMMKNGKSIKKGVTINEAALDWLNVIGKNRKHSTCIKYKNIYSRHIQHIIGSVSVSELGQDVVNSILSEKQDVSLSTQKSIVSVTNSILKYVLAKYSVQVYKLEIEMVRIPQKPVEALSKTEQMKLMSYLHSNRDIYTTGIMLCLATGIRLGEICALKWEDIDMENKLLHINRTVQRIAVEGRDTKTALVEDEPKSSFSKRIIPLADVIVEWLLPYYRESGYVLMTDRPMEPRTYQNKYACVLFNALIR